MVSSIHEFVWEEEKTNMINENKYDINSSIPKEEFELAHSYEEHIHDTKFETRPVGWFEDSLRRFCKNPSSVVGFVLIAIFVLFSLIVPVASPYNHIPGQDFKKNGFYDANYNCKLPKLFDVNAAGFWDGTEYARIGSKDRDFLLYYDSNSPIILKDDAHPKFEETTDGTKYSYNVRIDRYAQVGIQKVNLSDEEYLALQNYEAEKNITYKSSTDVTKKDHTSILKPLIDYYDYLDFELYDYLVDKYNVNYSTYTRIADQIKVKYDQNPGIYYKLIPTEKKDGKPSDTAFTALLDAEGHEQPLYAKDGDNLIFRSEDNDTVRVDYNAYFRYKYHTEPKFLFGTNSEGRDLFTRLAEGGRFSLLLGVCISLINFIIGLVWGAVSGYYGGVVDLTMERITDIISAVPSIIILTIVSVQFTSNPTLMNMDTGLSMIITLLITFVVNGWVGVAGTTRMQFYRFKGQEYVLASRTLGAKDRRLIFKHILPNAAGTLVTSCVLLIPGMIFAESSLSFLGLIDFRNAGLVSIGALIAEGQSYLKTDAYLMLAPAIIVSVLMIAFNMFGNGLRDAFNTTLRGSED